AADGSSPCRLDDVASDGRLGQPTAWLFGNEAWGLPADVLDLADQAVAVPIYGRAESLNLAAAAAVCLYASARAQVPPVPPARSGGPAGNLTEPAVPRTAGLGDCRFPQRRR
ncbi:MAG: TrmH family RNA methyltransferase, partial [Streptosporangiaceae bacterium]